MATKKPKESKTQAKNPPGTTPALNVAAVWPHQECPLLLSKVGSQQSFIATSFSPINFEDLAAVKVENWVQTELLTPELNQFPRWMALLPYETYADDNDTRDPRGDRPLAWQIDAGLVWGKDDLEPTYVSKKTKTQSRFHLEPPRIKQILSEASKIKLEPLKPINLSPSTSDDTYLESVRGILRSIHAGDFYQINFLRFFYAPKGNSWENLCSLMASNSGPHGMLLSMGNRIVASFSPERFIEIEQTTSSAKISTWPIKGSAPGYISDKTADLASAKALEQSSKDRAELHMIIDLMRNDFSRICKSGSVIVTDSGSIKKCFQIWHLEGQVTGILNSGLSLDSILSAICPGGSVTGAPKRAAMQRIKLEEGRPRGYFMGNFLRINHDGSLQSNIMIRTLRSDDGMRTASYAAGSGIVAKSDPQIELLEIATKCAPVALTANKKTDKHIESEPEE